MSIVRLKKITIFECLSEKQEVLNDLQKMGCLHIIGLNVQKKLSEKPAPITHIREALKHMQSCPSKLRQVQDTSAFDPSAIENQVLQNKHAIEELQNERDSLQRQVEELRPWGNFVLPDPEELGNQKLWFYVIPHQDVPKIKRENLCCQQINKDNLFCYVAVISGNEPESMPGAQVKLSRTPLKELEKRVDQIEFALEDLQAQRIQLTRWLDLFERNVLKLEDQAALQEVAGQTFDTHPVFALQAWIPSSEVKKVVDYGKEKGFAITIENPKPGENPPTLLSNNPLLRGGEDLTSFYMTPSYWLWDPSILVLFSFAIFFAMILSDAGYALVLGAILAFFWKRMGQTPAGKHFRVVLLMLTTFSIVWGILVGSYFGLSPHADSFLGKLKIVDMQNYPAMMGLSILVGAVHIIIANLAQAWSLRHSSLAIANIGWAAALAGGVIVFLGYKIPGAAMELKFIGFTLIGLGLIAVVLFTSMEKPFWRRLLSGFLGLTRVSGMFGDVLSYLRLFALGLASASLAGVFNAIAKQVYASSPGFKIAFTLLIILIGHSMNFALSMMSGFIHGLRLNYIEFFNWSLPEEGRPFRVFSKKETSKWNH